MADLRIVDAPLLSTVKGTEKIPTGGEGNFSVSVNQVVDFAKLKWFLATEGYVDNAVGNVQADLNLHKNDESNPHNVTKTQVGLGNVDNTADLDKPLSNATQSAIITATSGKADKSYVDSQDQLKADKVDVEASLLLKADKVDLTASKILSDGNQTQQSINDFGGARWYAKSGGYALGATVKLENGDIVKSTEPNNSNNPNFDITGWVFPISNGQQLNYNKVLYVGVAEKHKTIGSALNELSKDKPIHVFNDDSEYRANIIIKSGFIVNEQININAIDFGFVTITSEDAEVIVNQAALVKKVGRWYSFIRCKNGSIPNIGTLFNLNRNGVVTAERTGLYMINARGFVSENCGIKNSGDRNCDITQCSILNCGRGIFTGAGVLNFRPATGSTVFMQYANVSDAPVGISCSTGARVGAENLVANNCSDTAVSVQGGVSIDLTSADLSGAGQYGLRATTASITNASRLIANNCKYGVYAENSAVVDVQGATINNSTTVGILASTGATVNAKGATLNANQVGVISETGSTVTITTSDSVISNSVQQSLVAQNGGTIIANNANYRRGVSDSAIDATVSNYGTIIAIGSTGGVNQLADVMTEKGIIVKGAKSRSKGQATLPAGATSVTVLHGLGGIPLAPTPTPNGNIGSGNTLWATARTETTFDIRIGLALASPMLFYWTAEI